MPWLFLKFKTSDPFSQNWCKDVSKTLAIQAATWGWSGNQRGATSCDFWLLSIFQVLHGSVVAFPFKNKLPIFSFNGIHVIQGKVIAKKKMRLKRKFHLKLWKKRTLVLNLEPKLWFAHVFNVNITFSKGKVFLAQGIGSWPGANLVFTSDTFRIIWEVFENYLRGFRIIWEVLELYQQSMLPKDTRWGSKEKEVKQEEKESATAESFNCIGLYIWFKTKVESSLQHTCCPVLASVVYSFHLRVEMVKEEDVTALLESFGSIRFNKATKKIKNTCAW